MGGTCSQCHQSLVRCMSRHSDPASYARRNGTDVQQEAASLMNVSESEAEALAFQIYLIAHTGLQPTLQYLLSHCIDFGLAPVALDGVLGHAQLPSPTARLIIDMFAVRHAFVGSQASGTSPNILNCLHLHELLTGEDEQVIHVSALSVAVLQDHPHVLQFLLDVMLKCCQILATDTDADSAPFPSLFRHLLRVSHTVKNMNLLQVAVLLNRSNCIRVLLPYFFGSESQDTNSAECLVTMPLPDGRSLVQVAVERCSLEVVEQLLFQEASGKDHSWDRYRLHERHEHSTGNSILHSAACRLDVQILRQVLDVISVADRDEVYMDSSHRNVSMDDGDIVTPSSEGGASDAPANSPKTLRILLQALNKNGKTAEDLLQDQLVAITDQLQRGGRRDGDASHSLCDFHNNNHIHLEGVLMQHTRRSHEDQHLFQLMDKVLTCLTVLQEYSCWLPSSSLAVVDNSSRDREDGSQSTGRKSARSSLHSLPGCATDLAEPSSVAPLDGSDMDKSSEDPSGGDRTSEEIVEVEDSARTVDAELSSIGLHTPPRPRRVSFDKEKLAVLGAGLTSDDMEQHLWSATHDATADTTTSSLSTSSASNAGQLLHQLFHAPAMIHQLSSNDACSEHALITESYSQEQQSADSQTVHTSHHDDEVGAEDSDDDAMTACSYSPANEKKYHRSFDRHVRNNAHLYASK